MTNRTLADVNVSWDGSSLLFTDPSSSKLLCSITAQTAGTTTITVTTTSATSAYTGAASSLSATAANTGEAVLGGDLPTY